MRKLSLLLFAAAIIGLALGWNIDGFIFTRLGLDLLSLFIALGVISLICSLFLIKSVCAVCSSDIGRATPKYTIKNNAVICDSCFSKTGYTDYSMKTITAFMQMSVEDVKVLFDAKKEALITEHNSIAPPEHITENKVSVPSEINGYPMAYHYENVKIAVLRGQEPDYTLIEAGVTVELIQEPTNKHDKNAVMIMANGVKFGYVYKGKLQDMVNDFINSDYPIFSCVTTINPTDNIIKIFLGFYRGKHDAYQNLINSGKPFKKFKLTSNSNGEMQSNISYCNIGDYKGDEVAISYDYEKEKHLASCGVDIGFFPASAEKYLGGSVNTAFLDEITENDNGKYVVTVILPIEVKP